MPMDPFDAVCGRGRTTRPPRHRVWWLDGEGPSGVVRWLDDAYEAGCDTLYLEEEPRGGEIAAYAILGRSDEPVEVARRLRRALTGEEAQFIGSRWPKQLRERPQRLVEIGPLHEPM